MLVGCGTFNTVTKTNEAINRDMVAKGTYCETVPRVYSGVSYDFCRLNAKTKDVIYANVALSFILTDILFSAVTDTVVLPFSIAQQVNHGSVEIKKP